jgi:hypothetical protein
VLNEGPPFGEPSRKPKPEQGGGEGDGGKDEKQRVETTQPRRTDQPLRSSRNPEPQRRIDLQDIDIQRRPGMEPLPDPELPHQVIGDGTMPAQREPDGDAAESG